MLSIKALQAFGNLVQSVKRVTEIKAVLGFLHNLN